MHRDGQPWSKTQLIAQARFFPYSYGGMSQNIETDEQGAFRIVLDQPCPKGGKRIYKIQIKGQANGPECDIDLSRDYPAGTSKLGEILLDFGTLVVSGIVVDSKGMPVHSARIRVEQLVKGTRRDLWPRVDTLGDLSSKKDGTFALYLSPGALLPTGELRVSARYSKYPNTARAHITLGDRNVRLELLSGGSLSGRVTFQYGQEAEDIVVIIQGQEQSRLPRVDAEGRFVQKDLTPGEHKLIAYLRADSDEVRTASRVVVDQLLINSGETNRDPRIQGMILKGNVHKLRLTVLDASSNPVRGAELRIVGVRSRSSIRTDSKGVALLRPQSLPIDVSVVAFGFRDGRVTQMRKDRHLLLKPGLRVRLVTEAKPIGKDPAYHLGGVLYHVSAAGKRGSRIYGRSFPYDRRYFNERGHMELRLPGPGSYEFRPRFFLSSKDNVGRGGSPKMESYPRFTLREDSKLQSFHIFIPAAALADAIKKASGGR